LLWLLFVVREVWRRGFTASEAVDERVIREMLLADPPEIIAARWSGVAEPPRIEPFLRRLEKQHKIAITIEQQRVTLRLIVSREQLAPYERLAIDALMPEGWETTSEQVQARREADEEALGPLDLLYLHLHSTALLSKGPAKAPWYSRLTSFAIFLFGLYTLIFNLKEAPHEPMTLFASLIAASTLMSLWPDNLTRALLRDSLWAVLIPLIPIAVATTFVFGINLVTQSPLSVYGAGGISLVMLAIVKACLASSATRAMRAEVRRRAVLVRIRRWLRDELRREHPRLPGDILPYLRALGLPTRNFEHAEQAEEDWGELLVA
jgi:hypothetical protein